MKGWVKCIIAGAVITVIGIGLVIGTLAFNGWSVKKPQFEMRTYTAENENTEIDVSIGAGSVKTEFYDGDRITVEYPSSSVFKSEISENNGVFKYESRVRRFMFWGTLDIPDTVIKLPKDKIFDAEFEIKAGSITVAEGVYGKLEIEVNAGKLTVNNSECQSLVCSVDAGLLEINGLSCNTFESDVSAGKLDVSGLVCPDIKADVSAGELVMNINGAKADYTIRTHVSAGSCNVSAQTGATDKKLDLDCSAGSVKVSFAG